MTDVPETLSEFTDSELEELRREAIRQIAEADRMRAEAIRRLEAIAAAQARHRSVPITRSPGVNALSDEDPIAGGDSPMIEQVRPIAWDPILSERKP
jgi:hypothetical protein